MSEEQEKKEDKKSKKSMQISIDTMDIYEQKHKVNTPRSIQACRKEGIHPKELLYKPPEVFKEVSKDSNVQELHFKFFEQKRKNLIQQVKNAKQRILSEEQQHSIFKTYSDQNQFASSVFSSTMKSSDTLSKAQTKQLRLIENMLRNEEMMITKFNELQKQNELRQLKFKEEQLKQQQLEKKKLEQQRLREIKKKEILHKEEVLTKKAAQQIFKKQIVNQQRAAELEEKKKKELKLKMIINEKKRQEQIQRAEENLRKAEKERFLR